MRLHEIVITPCSVYMYFSLQYGETALMMASSDGHVECIKLLLDKGASADHLDEVSAGSHQLLSVLHVLLCKMGIVVVACVYNSTLSVATCICLYLSLTCV